MIEHAVYNTLQSISGLGSYIDRQDSGKLKVFNGYGFKGMNGRYIIYTLDEYSTESVVIKAVNMYINIYGPDRTDIKRAAALCENAFDERWITDSTGEYTNIRGFFEDGSFIQTEDETKLSHFNQQFTLRACRQAWANQL